MKTARTPTLRAMTRKTFTRRKRARRRATDILVIGLLGIGACVGACLRSVQADDERAGNAGFPPPLVQPAGKEAEADTDWSRPSTPPVAAVAETRNGGLPPPQIVRRSRRAPSRSAFPASTATAQDTRDLPSARAFSTAPGGTNVLAPIADPIPVPIALPTTPDTRRLQARAAPTRSAQGTCRILSITKTHNVEDSDVQRGGLFLQLDVEYEVQGQQGRDVFIGIWFARKADGRLVRSLSRRYADAADNLTIQTRWTRVLGANMRYAAKLLIPYSTFPAHESAGSYEIDARVQLLRNEARGQVSLLARDKTTFRVYGLPEDEQEPAPTRSDGLDRVGIATAGEGGEIMEPGIPTGFGAKDVAGEAGTILTPGIQDGSGPKATPGEAGAIEDISK